MTVCPEHIYLATAVACLESPSPMTAADARAEALKCARRINVCLDAAQYVEARHQLAEAKRFTLLALELERAA